MHWNSRWYWRIDASQFPLVHKSNTPIQIIHPFLTKNIPLFFPSPSQSNDVNKQMKPKFYVQCVPQQRIHEYMKHNFQNGSLILTNTQNRHWMKGTLQNASWRKKQPILYYFSWADKFILHDYWQCTYQVNKITLAVIKKKEKKKKFFLFFVLKVSNQNETRIKIQ